MSATGKKMSDHNKWLKNGYGERIPPPPGNGSYTKEESALVQKAIKEYCLAKSISAEKLCSELEHKTEFRGAWMKIAQVLPKRSVQSVYRHGLRINHPYKRGAWSEEEMEKLCQLVAQHGKKWVIIQNSLNRDSNTCRDKYREICDDFDKGRWSEEDTQKLEKLIRENVKADPRATMGDIGVMIETQGIQVPWSAICAKMETRSRLSCFKKFQKMTGIFAPSERKLHAAGRNVTYALTDPAAVIARMPDATTDGPPPTKKAKTRKRKTKLEETLSGGNEDVDEETYLLSELANSGASRAPEVPWHTIRVDDAQDRWNVLVADWQQQEGEEATDEVLTTYPLYELAQLLLDRKTSAKMAAETVEAVDLPVV